MLEVRILKLRVSRQRLIDRGKITGMITTRRVSEEFFQTLRKTQKQNPSLTQRVGIAGNSQLQDECFVESELRHGQRARRPRSRSADVSSAIVYGSADVSSAIVYGSADVSSAVIQLLGRNLTRHPCVGLGSAQRRNFKECLPA